MLKHHWLSLLIWAVLLVAAQSLVGANNIPGAWYAQLTKPVWTPPNWLFAPVWTLLYIMIAAAGWRLWWTLKTIMPMPLKHPLMLLYGLQLVLNTLWSPLFFGLHLPLAALLDLSALVLLVLLLVRKLYAIDRLGAQLLLPYLAWISYAWTLNAGIVALN